MKGSEEDECLTGGWIPDEFQAMKLFQMEILLYCADLNQMEKQVWKKVSETFRIQKCSCFREYIKYCVPPLFQSPFNLTQGRAAAVYLGLIQ